jgi:DNA-binding protein YbaB
MNLYFIKKLINITLQYSNFAGQIFKIIKMDLMGMMGKLKETQRKIEETKLRLDSVLIDEQSNDGELKVTFTANGKLKSISIADSLLEDKEQLEDYLIVTLNKAIEKAAKVNQAELDAVAKVDMPMIPGMDEMFK